jgi:hypothetical protein
MPRNRLNPSNKTALLCTLLAALFLIILGSGCRKETDEFRRRPLSNGKVFIQIGGRKWMIDDSFPSLFSGDNAGKINAPRGEYVTEETVNGTKNKVVSFICESNKNEGKNITSQLILTYSEQGGVYSISSASGYVSKDVTNPDSTIHLTRVVSSNLKKVSRINYCWHEGEVTFEAKPKNQNISITQKISVKFIFTS